MRICKTCSVLALAALLAMLALPAPPIAAAWFDVPSLSDHFSFGTTPAVSGTATRVENMLGPFDWIASAPGIWFPAAGLNLFRRPYTSHRSYQQTIVTPDGPETRTIDQSYDGLTDERITTQTIVR